MVHAVDREKGRAVGMPAAAGPTRRPKPDTAREEKMLRRFLAVYCRTRHGRKRSKLCRECMDLERYALDRLRRCPYDPKPQCRKCSTHCYNPEYRRRIRDVMRFSGIWFVKRGRVDWLIRYFMT